jgi:hypothetical protein
MRGRASLSSARPGGPGPGAVSPAAHGRGAGGAREVHPMDFKTDRGMIVFNVCGTVVARRSTRGSATGTRECGRRIHGDGRHTCRPQLDPCPRLSPHPPAPPTTPPVAPAASRPLATSSCATSPPASRTRTSLRGTATWSEPPSLREHPHRPGRQQGRRQGAQGQGQADHLPPQEEPRLLLLRPSHAKSNYIFEKPLLHLARKLTGIQDLACTEAPAYLPPEVALSREQVEQQERELNEAQNMPLPEDNDDL